MALHLTTPPQPPAAEVTLPRADAEAVLAVLHAVREQAPYRGGIYKPLLTRLIQAHSQLRAALAVSAREAAQ